MVKRKYNIKRANNQDNCRKMQRSKIGIGTSYSFTGANMSPFGGIFAAGCFAQQFGLEKLLADRITTERKTAVSTSQYLLSVMYLLYIGYERFAHVQYVKDDPIFQRILDMERLPVQSSFWRFFNKSLDQRNEDQLRKVIFEIQRRVWEAGNVRLRRIHIDTDTTVETVYGDQENSCVGYNPGHRGKKSYQPVISTIAETGEFICGRQRSGDTISGEEIAEQLDQVFTHLPPKVEYVTSRMDSGFYCKEAIEKHEQYRIHYTIAVKKHAPIQQEIVTVRWKKCKISDGIAEFWYQPGGWKKPHRFVVARYKKQNADEQTEMFEDIAYKYRVFVTDLCRKPHKVVTEYDGRANIESLIEESKNQIAMAKIPGKSFATNAIFMQVVLLAFNLNKWLQLIGRIEGERFQWEEIKTSRFKHLYIASRIVETGRKTIIRFASDYPYKEYFNRLIQRLRRIVYKEGDIQYVVMTNLVPGFS
jgi:Transposase DDE domain group 1